MNIVIVTNQCRTLVNFWTAMLRLLRAEGHGVTCLVPEGDAESESVLRHMNVRIRHYPLDRKGLNPLRDSRTLLALYRTFVDLRREGLADAVFLYTIKPVIYGLWAAALAKIPMRCAMITGLGYMFEADTPIKKILRGIAALLYRSSLYFSNAVLFQNDDDVQTFRTFHCLPAKANVVMTRGTGVDIAHFGVVPLPEGETPVFLLVARLLEAKGLHEYAEAARLVKKLCPAARFQVLGPPETGLGGVPLATVLRWQNEGLIEYLGETRDTRPFVAGCSVVVLPSWREGLPCSLMEAMSCGRALIATDVPGCRDVVRHEDNGLLVPVKNAKALAEACVRFVRDPALAARMGQSGRAMAEAELDAEKAARQIFSVMQIPYSVENSDDCKRLS